jgi:hypothetical protein
MTMPDEKMTLPLNAMPFDEMIASMGTGIAEAQRKLDEISFEITKMMSGTEAKYRIRLSDGADARTYSLLELGFAPTFYQFVDTVLEVKVAFSMSSETSNSGSDRGKYQAKSTPVDATYSNRYQYPVEGSSVMRTKLVTVPPPGLLEGRVRELVESEQRR